MFFLDKIIFILYFLKYETIFHIMKCEQRGEAVQKLTSIKLKKRKIPGPYSEDILKKAKSFEPLSMADQLPIVWEKGEGVWITDVDGNIFLDFTSGVLVTNIGHSHPYHVDAVKKQADALMNCYSFPTQERIELSKRLVEVLPENIDKVFLLTTGAEATEAAIRIAKRYSGKHEILSFYGAFHGRTYGPMSVAGNITTRKKFGPSVPGGIMAPYGNCYRCVYNKKFPECDYYCIKILDNIIDSSSSGDLGAVITEPYQGAAGFIFPPKGWLKELEKWAHKRGLILIIDEVQSSFGRTGKLFAVEWEDIKPQMICLGKGLGSGIPTSALAGEEKIFSKMLPGEMSSTTGGNPLSSAAALSVLDIMEKEKLPENSRRLGEYLLSQLTDLWKKYDFIGDVRGMGLVIGIEIVNNKNPHFPNSDLCKKIILRCAELGLMLGRVGTYGNVIRVAPPLIIKEEECDLAVDIFDRVMGGIKQ
jgi:4-aminobutyrate aminotransferase